MPANLNTVNDAAVAEIAGCRFETAADGGLVLITPAGQRHTGVTVIRAFPLSAPAGPLAMLDVSGRELLWADSLQTVPAASRWLVAAHLAAAEFLPRIEGILSASRREPVTWRVLTDRGHHTFELAADGVERQPDGAVTVTDTAGIRYLIPAVQQLDRRSRRLLDRVS